MNVQTNELWPPAILYLQQTRKTFGAFWLGTPLSICTQMSVSSKVLEVVGSREFVTKNVLLEQVFGEDSLSEIEQDHHSVFCVSFGHSWETDFKRYKFHTEHGKFYTSTQAIRLRRFGGHNENIRRRMVQFVHSVIFPAISKVKILAWFFQTKMQTDFVSVSAFLVMVRNDSKFKQHHFASQQIIWDYLEWKH